LNGPSIISSSPTEESQPLPSLGKIESVREFTGDITLHSSKFPIKGAMEVNPSTPKPFVLITLPGANMDRTGVMREMVEEQVAASIAQSRPGITDFTHLSIEYNSSQRPSEVATQINALRSELAIPDNAQVLIVAHSQGAFVANEVAQLGTFTSNKQDLILVDPPKICDIPVIGEFARVGMVLGDMLSFDTDAFGRNVQPQVGLELYDNYENVVTGANLHGSNTHHLPTQIHNPFEGSVSDDSSIASQSSVDLQTLRESIDKSLGF